MNNAKRTFLVMMFFLVLLGCKETATISNTEDTEYQKFVTIARAKLSDRPITPQETLRQYERESGLFDLTMELSGKELNKEDLSNCDKFYNDVLKGRYATHDYQEYLKSKYIFFAVESFNLTTPDDFNESELLIKYTRELASCKRDFNFELTHRCLASTKGLIPTDEYDKLVKGVIFNIRFGIEQMEKSISDERSKKTSDAEFFVRGLEKWVEKMKVQQSDFEALRK